MTPTDWESLPSEKPSQNGRNGLTRLPPHSIQAEQGVLGCILLSPADTLPQALAAITEPEVFYDLRHRSIWAELLAMYSAGSPVDMLTVQQRLKDNNLLEAVGGPAYISSLPDQVPSAANLAYYLTILIEKKHLRDLVLFCTETVSKVYDFEGDAKTVLDQAEAGMLALSLKRTGQRPVKTMREVIQSSITRIEDMTKGNPDSLGIETGFVDFDRYIGGLRKSELIIVAARPSQGKTSLALNICEFVSSREIPVGLFSLEMSSDELGVRFISSGARVNVRNFRAGGLQERDFPKLTRTAGRLSKAPIYIDDSPDLTVMQLRSRARQMLQQYKIGLFVVDYLQMVKASLRHGNREGEIREVSQALKVMAKEFRVPVLALCAMNREVEKRAGGRPKLSDLRESGSVESDADMVAFLYKPEGEGASDSEAVPMKLLVEKDRNGPTGEIDLTFIRSYTRFESAAKISDADVPEPEPQRVMFPDQ